MGVDPKRLGPVAKNVPPPKDGSGLERAFRLKLQSLGLPPAERDVAICPAMGKHRADFLWRNVPPRGERGVQRSLAVFVDGPVHGLRGRLADTLRAVNLAAFLPPEWTVLRFAGSQLRYGAQIVLLWHEGRMAELFEILKRPSSFKTKKEARHDRD